MAVTATVKATIEGSQTNVLDLGTATIPLSIAAQIDFTDGVAANQVNQLFTDRRTLTASANEDLDMAGSLTNPFGVAIAFARIKAILIKASAANTNNVQVTRPASNGVPFMLAAGDGVTLPPGGMFLLVAPSAAGYAVTAGTGDLINVANSAGGTSVDYDVTILGGLT